MLAAAALVPVSACVLFEGPSDYPPRADAEAPQRDATIADGGNVADATRDGADDATRDGAQTDAPTGIDASDAALCGQMDAPCASGTPCCSGYACANNRCLFCGADAGRPPGGACMQNQDCCSKMCNPQGSVCN